MYDAHAGGVGIAAAAFRVIEPVYRDALAMIERCECEDGCPACIHDSRCREFNYVLDKAAAIVVLRSALGAPPSAWGAPSLPAAAT